MDEDTDERLLLAAGRAVRPYLPGLLEAETANAVDGELARLLADAAGGATVGPQLAAVLARHEPVRDWTSEFVERGEPADVAGAFERVYEELPGDPRVGPDKYVCPEGDYTYYRRTVGVEVPQCPTHQVALTPAAADA